MEIGRDQVGHRDFLKMIGLGFLDRYRRWGVPLSKVCWGTDYPCFENLETLVENFLSMNEDAGRLAMPRISDEEMELMLAGNFLRFCGLE